MRRAAAPLAALVVALWAAAALVWVGGANHDAAAAAPRYKSPAVEVAAGVDVDQAAAAAIIERLVNDPRGWRTDLDRYVVRIVQPGTMGTDGLGGYIGRAHIAERLAVIAADAWTTVNPRFVAVGGTLADQRTWIVLHELGHLLGHDHEECPGSGPAPVMRSWSYNIRGCAFNIWPHPRS